MALEYLGSTTEINGLRKMNNKDTNVEIRTSFCVKDSALPETSVISSALLISSKTNGDETSFIETQRSLVVSAIPIANVYNPRSCKDRHDAITVLSVNLNK